MTGEPAVEPWLRGTLNEFDAVRRQVLHALVQAQEDIPRWCGDLSSAEYNAKPHELASVCFHLRHIGRSLDRLLTYAEGQPLSARQLEELQSEGESSPAAMLEFHHRLANAIVRIGAIDLRDYEQVRHVGRRQLPTTLGGLLVHCAEHTQRHVGQAIITAKVVRALRSLSASAQPPPSNAV